MQGIVVPPVLKLFFDAAAHLELEIGRHGHIARVEQTMDVAAKEDAVRCVV